MGNEISKSKELTKPEKNLDNRENGSVKGVTVITSNGLEIDANRDASVQKNGGPPSVNLSTESTDTGFVVVQQIEAAAISEFLEVAKEEVKKNKEEKVLLFSKMFRKKTEPPTGEKSSGAPETSDEVQTAVSVPASDPQTELGSNGEEDAATTISGQVDDCLHRTVEMSTQTDRKSQADISTQTGDDDDDDDRTTNTNGRVEEETSATEDYSPSGSVVVIAEDAVKDVANDNQTGFIIEEVVAFENDVYENITFRAERVEATEMYEEESANESEPEVSVEADPKITMDGDIFAEEHDVGGTVPLEMFSSLPSVVADCVEAVLADVRESMDVTPVNTSKPIGDDEITQDNGEGAVDMSADTGLIETKELKSKAAKAFEAMVFRAEQVEVADNFKVNHVRNQDEESVNEMESEITAASNPNKSISGGETAADRNGGKETVLLENYSSLPKVVADCIQAVFTGVCESAEFLFADNSEPSVDEVITVDNGETAGEMEEMEDSADVLGAVDKSSEVSQTVSSDETAAKCVDAAIETIVEDIPEEECNLMNFEELTLEAIMESEPCASVQEELVEETVNPANMLIKYADKEAGAPSVVAVKEPIGPSPITSEEVVEQSASPVEPEVLAVTLKTTENRARDKPINEKVNSTGDLAAMDVTPVNTSEPIGDDKITQDNGEGAGDMSADTGLIETKKLKSKAAKAFEAMVFRAEQVEVTDNFKVNHVRNHGEERVNEMESEVTAASNPNKSFSGGETAADENDVEETVPLENYSSLPKVVADCIQAVFTGVCESAEFSLADNSEPSLDELITEDNGETAGDISAEATKPESDAVAPEARKGNHFPSLDEEPVTTAKETISEVVLCEEPSPTLANQDVSIEEASVPVVTEVVVMVESANKEVTADGAVAAEDEPGINEEFIIIETPSSGLITFEEVPEVILYSPNEEVMPKSIPEVSKNVTADIEQAEPSSVIAREDADVEIAIDALSQELCATTHQELTVDKVIFLEEDATAATMSELLSGEKEANLPITEELSKKDTAEMNEEAMWASNEIKAVLVDKTAGMLQTGEAEPYVSVLEKLVEENVTPADMPLEDADKDAAYVAAVKEHTGSSPVTSDEPVEETMSLHEPQVPSVILRATEDDVRGEIMHETEDYADVLGAVDKRSEVSQSVSSDETVAKCVDVALETIVEDIPEEECTLMKFEELTLEVIMESELCASVQEELVEDIVAPVVGAVEELTGFLEPPVLVVIPERSEDAASRYNPVTSEEVVPEILTDVEPCVSIQEELVEETVNPANMLIKDADKEAGAPSVVAVKEPIGPSPITSEEVVEQSASPVEPEVLAITLKTTENRAIDKPINEKVNSAGDLAAMDVTPVNTSEPIGDDEITQDNGEGAGDMSADTGLIETKKLKSKAAKAFESMVFRAEQVEVTDNFKVNHVRNHGEESVNEMESEVTAASNPNKSFSGGETAADENDVEETVPLENYSSLPKVVADCIQAVFTGVCESAEFSFADNSEPSLDELITEDNGETAGDISAEATKPETDAVAPEARKGNHVPSLDEEPVTTAKETISEVVLCEEPSPTLANQDVSVEEASVPVVTEVVVMVESANKEVTADGAAAAEDEPGINEEFIIIETPSSGLITFEEVPEVIFYSPSGEVMPESIPEVSKNVTADIEQAEPSSVIAREDADVEIAIDALSQELCAITHQELTVDKVIFLEEDATAATMSELLSGEKEANLPITEELSKKDTAETNEEATWASNEIEAVLVDKTAGMLQTGEAEPYVSVLEKLVEENVTPADMPLEDADKDAAYVAAVKEHTGSSPVTSDEPVEETTSLHEPQVPSVILCATEDDVRGEIMHETEDSADVLGAVDKSSEVSQYVSSDETVAKCVDVALETIVEDINEEECNLMNFEELTLEVIMESEPCASVQEELVEDIVAPAVAAVEELTGFLEPKALVVIPDTAGVIANINKNSEDSRFATSDELVGEGVEAVLATIVEEVLTQDDAAEWNPVTSEEVAPEIIADADPCVSIQEELVGKTVNPVDMLVKDADKEAAAPSVVAVKEEEPTGSSPVTTEEDVEQSASPVEPEVLTVAIKTTENRARDEPINERINSAGDLASVGENSEDSRIARSDEPVVKSVEAVLETIADEVLPEECSFVASEEETPEVVAEGEEDSSVNSADSSPDMQELLVRLQSACTSAVEESAYRLGDLTMSSMGHNITVNIHDTANQKQQPQSLAEPESVTPEREPQEETAHESTSGDGEPVEKRRESIPEENPVMNFFKALVTPTKTAQKETATPDATKDQSQKVKQPAVTTTVAQVSEPPAAPKGMSVPPPPPPEPPRMEARAEVAAKAAKPSPRQEPKAAAKAPESSKAKSAKDTLNKLFRTKKMKEEPQPAVDVEVQPVVEVQETPAEEPTPVVAVQTEWSVEAQEAAEEEAQPVVEEQKVDPSKTGTLEAAPKLEPPPPVQVEKKTQTKAAFLSLFKPKAADPNKAAPAPAPAAEAAKTREEPKAAVKSPEVVVLSKPDSATPPAGVEVTNAPKKLEKRNSVQKFFKHLGQRRSSTDAGVQTEPVTIAPAAEKAK